MWKIKQNTLIIDLFSSNSNCMVWSSGAVAIEFRDVLQPIFFPVTLFTLILFWLGTQKSNTNLNNIFYTSLRLDRRLSEIDNVCLKKKSLLNNVSIIRLKSLIFSTFAHRHQKRSLTTNAMINSNAYRI